MWKRPWLSASPSVLLLPEQTETFLQPALAHPERSRSGWKCVPGERGEGRQTSTALGYHVPVCSLLYSQAPKPPKDKEARRQGGHGCMTSDCEGWRLAVSHAKWLVQEDFVPNFSFLWPVSWISTQRCWSSLDGGLFPRALKHSETPEFPQRNPYVSEDCELFFNVPLLTALLRKTRRLCGIGTC